MDDLQRFLEDDLSLCDSAIDLTYEYAFDFPIVEPAIQCLNDEIELLESGTVVSIPEPKPDQKAKPELRPIPGPGPAQKPEPKPKPEPEYKAEKKMEPIIKPELEQKAKAGSKPRWKKPYSTARKPRYPVCLMLGCMNRTLPNQETCMLHSKHVDEKLLCKIPGCGKLAVRDQTCEMHTNVTYKCLVKSRCSQSGCDKMAVFHIPGGPQTHCYDHKTMHDLPLFHLCQIPSCTSSAKFGKWTDPEPSLCSRHQHSSHFNLVTLRCEIPGCLERSMYNFPGAISDSCRCEKHIVDGMIPYAKKHRVRKRKHTEV